MPSFTIKTRPITNASKRGNSFYLTNEAVVAGRFTPGKLVTVSYIISDGDGDGGTTISTVGTIQPYGLLSGMVKHFNLLKLDVGDRLELDCNPEPDAQSATILNIIRADGNTETPQAARENIIAAAAAQAAGAAGDGAAGDGAAGDGAAGDGAAGAPGPDKPVLPKNGAKYIHFNIYQPELWGKWEPKSEADVYLAFGALQENTPFEYCCGVNVQILKDLGILHLYRGATTVDGARVGIPDAIVIDRNTDEYLIAEFKVNSSAFSTNHLAIHIDVLVCWEDDETNRANIPKHVVILKNKARDAAKAATEAED